MYDDLSAMEPEIERLFDEKLLDHNGIMYAALKLDEMRPWKESDFTENDLRADIPAYGKESGGFYSYENTGMAQGTFLSAMCYKYQVTGDPADLAKARRTYQGILKVYEMSQVIAPGFMCKPWDGVVRDETSSDQYIYVMHGLDVFYEFATAEEQKQIRTMIVAMARFWLDHHYDWKYYGEPLHWPEHRFIGFMAFAVKYGGGPEFEKEQERLTQNQISDFHTPFHSTIREVTQVDKDGMTRCYVNGEGTTSTMLSIEPAMRTKNCPRFMEICRDSLEFGKLAMAGDGTTHHIMEKDPVTGEIKEIDVKKTTYKSNTYVSPIFGLRGPYRFGGMQVTMFGRFVLMYEEYFPDCGGRAIAEDLLRQVGTKHFTWFEDPFGIFPDEIKWMTNMFYSDAPAHWLWCYWKMRLQEEESC